MPVRIALAAAVLLAYPAAAQPLPPEGQRTVQWYAAHDAERTRVRHICLNDPGHLENSPDCINAKRGDLQAAIRHAGQGVPGGRWDTPEYWTNRPAERRAKLWMCGNMTPAAQAADHCDLAQRSLAAEQRPSARH